MWRNSPSLFNFDMIDLISELDEVGYYSVLFPISSTNADYLPQAIRSINPDQSIKYMLPIRPYLLSPQYLAMISAGIEAIVPNRTMFNFIHGSLKRGESMSGIIHSSTNFYEKANRRSHLEDFVNTLHKLKIHDPVDFSESIISGGSLSTVEASQRLGIPLATSYSSLVSNHDSVYSKFSFEKMFVQVSILARETEEEAIAIEKSTNAIEQNPSGAICGSYQQVADELIRIRSLGVTDLLVSNAFDGGLEERGNVHKFVKYFRELGI
jgi:alkanesulfonate monooxygenase SsuD/methylene tetrahydromethanopterin reductase-like flavin-dependent oxidoreductase (luciferase family)